MSDTLYHYGVPKQKWGLRRYQNPDGSLTPLGRIHYGVKGVRKTKKNDRAKPSSKPKQQPEQTTLDNDAIKNDPALMKKLGEHISKKKKLKYVDAVRSGNKRQIKKVERHLSNEELKSALERIDLNYKLDDMKKARKASNLKRAKENVDNIATAADKAASLYNIVAGVSQAVDFLPDLPKINTKPTDPLDRQKKQLALETERLKRDKALLEKEEAERKQADAAEERLDKELKKERNKEKEINDKINKINKDIEESRKKTEETINEIKNETVTKPDVPESDDPWAYHDPNLKYNNQEGWGKEPLVAPDYKIDVVDTDQMAEAKATEDRANRMARASRNDLDYREAGYLNNKAVESNDLARDLNAARNTIRILDNFDDTTTEGPVPHISRKVMKNANEIADAASAKAEVDSALYNIYNAKMSNPDVSKYARSFTRKAKKLKTAIERDRRTEIENSIDNIKSNSLKANKYSDSQVKRKAWELSNYKKYADEIYNCYVHPVTRDGKIIKKGYFNTSALSPAALQFFYSMGEELSILHAMMSKNNYEG